MRFTAPDTAQAHFYRASGGAEVDLIIELPGRRPRAIEIKRSLDPKPRKGFHYACEEMQPEARFVVYPGDEQFSIAKDIPAINMIDLGRELRSLE